MQVTGSGSVATCVSQQRCTACVSPLVVVYSKVDYVWRGQQVTEGIELGKRLDQYLGGRALVRPTGFNASWADSGKEMACPSAQTGGKA